MHFVSCIVYIIISINSDFEQRKKYHVAYIFGVFGTAYVFDDGFQCGKNNNSLATEEASIKSLHVQFLFCPLEIFHFG